MFVAVPLLEEAECEGITLQGCCYGATLDEMCCLSGAVLEQTVQCCTVAKCLLDNGVVERTDEWPVI